jgi:beta-lactamase regulating signal transducer with metallopeptidase domain
MVNLSELHTFLIYGMAGYLLLYPAALLFLKLGRIGHPAQRKQFYLLALLTPLLGFIAYHTVLTKRCAAGLLPAGKAGELFAATCAAANSLLLVILPVAGVFIFLGLLRAAAGALMVRRLRRRAAAPPPRVAERVQEILGRQCAALGIRVPELIFSGRQGFTAFTAGLFKPVLVLNGSIAAMLEQTELEALIAHELAHARRKDTFKGWLVCLLRDILFFNPLSSLLLNRLFLENERLCDAEAIRLTGTTRLSYAAVLIRVWRLALEQPSGKTGLASAFAGRGRDLERRITGLLRDPAAEKKLPGLLFHLMLLAFFTGSILFLGLIC